MSHHSERLRGRSNRRSTPRNSSRYVRFLFFVRWGVVLMTCDFAQPNSKSRYTLSRRLRRLWLVWLSTSISWLVPWFSLFVISYWVDIADSSRTPDKSIEGCRASNGTEWMDLCNIIFRGFTFNDMSWYASELVRDDAISRRIQLWWSLQKLYFDNEQIF